VTRRCAERLGGKPRVATFDDATPNSGTVVFVDAAGVTRTLDIVSAPFGLDATEVHATALDVEILDDADTATGTRFFVMHPVLCMESRVHNVVGLRAAYDTEHGRKQVRASILFAREFLRDAQARAARARRAIAIRKRRPRLVLLLGARPGRDGARDGLSSRH